MGNKKGGTLGKLSRRVRRNTERAMKARGKREKAMQEASFVKGFGLGAELRMVRLLNATAGYEYEATENVVVDAETPAAVVGGEHCSDPMSDGPLASVVSEGIADFAIRGALATQPSVQA